MQCGEPKRAGGIWGTSHLIVRLGTASDCLLKKLPEHPSAAQLAGEQLQQLSAL